MTTRLAALTLGLALAAPASAINVQGVEVPEKYTLEGKELGHNGSGVRKKFIVKVYVGSLYLPAPLRSAEEIVAADELKVVRMHFMRDVGKDDVLGAFRDGFRANSPDVAEKLAPKLERLARALPEEMKEGRVLTIAWVPGKGSVIQAQGGSEVIIEGKDFSDALFRNWFGPKPADDGLKKRMVNG
jgi:hypothetical protein